MKQNLLLKLTVVMSVLALLSSCKMSERFIYFQGNASEDMSPASVSTIIKNNDVLSVIVASDKPEAAKPFNFPRNEIGLQQNMQGFQQQPLGMPILDGYLVDEAGFIHLPILGPIQAAGLTRQALMDTLLPIYGLYLTNPVVNIKIMNYRVSVLGDVRAPGVKLVSNERITVLEALALAGDLNPTANRKNILVIRETNNQRLEYRLDITSKNIFSSPAYYLEQNDIVYVEPNLAAQSQGTFWRTTLPTVATLASFVITTLVLITR
jgi:polysaccharide biosynthesis/export protein